MEKRDATRYPTRYDAFDNPRILFEQTKEINTFEQTGKIEWGGFEYAVFYSPITNVMYPHLTDGTYAEIVSYQGKDFLASYHFTAPDQTRKQVNRSLRFRTYAEAKTYLLSLLGEK